MADCWQCGAERGRASFCPGCDVIQPVIRNTSYFETLSLEPKMRLDRAAFDKAYRDLSRRVHPDRFGASSSIERKLALEQTTHVNDAYRTLKKPRTRAEYLMRRRGRQVGGEADRVEDMEFLTEMMTLREALFDAEDARSIEPLRASVDQRYEDILESLEAFFDRDEGGEDLAMKSLEQLRFLERFLDEVDAKFDV